MNIRMRPELIPYDLQWHRIDKVFPPLDEEVYIWPISVMFSNGPPYATATNPESCKATTHWRKIIGPEKDD